MQGNVQSAGNEDKTSWRVIGWGAAAMLLLLPFFAMQFTDEVNWTLGDFAVFGVMLLSVGLAFELALKVAVGNYFRMAAALALAAAFILLWVNLAVGIIGNSANPANMLFFAVLAVFVVGTAIARFKPVAMQRVMYATAFAQASVALIALLVGLNPDGPNRPWEILLLTGFFVVLWLVSAWLFGKAAREQIAVVS